jgi:hypothetical protein
VRTLLAAALLLQATTFDIATFSVPPGWQRTDQNGIVQLQTTKTVGRRTAYCQIFLFPSHPGSADAMQNFGAEWTRLIAQPFGVIAIPRPETKQSPDGWTAVTSAVNVMQRGIPVTAILFTVTGHGRVMSVVINETGQDYTAEIRGFIGSLVFRAPAADQPPGPVALNPPSQQAAPQQPPSSQGAPGAPASLADYVYTIPQTWTRTVYPDGIVYGSQLFSNGERCQISVFPPRPATGNLAADARNAYAQIFQTDPLQNNAYPYPPATFSRGISADGWSYFIIRKSIHGQSGDYGTLLGTRLLAAQIGNQVAIITSTGKDPEVSMCFGEIVHDEWPPFFFSIHFKNWTPASQDREMPRRIAGTWTTATASVADRYTFAPNGRYASAAAAMNRTRISQTEILQTTNAYFGDGAYAIQGSAITLTADGDRANPKHGWIRLEQDSKDGATWTDRLCLLLEGIGGDVCYARDPGP